MLINSDTIVAVSTPAGRGGIGVIRISGSSALSFAKRIIADTAFDPTPNKTYYKFFRDPVSGEVLDRGMLTYFAAPKSYTGEDVVELSCHGSPVLLNLIVDVISNLGARPAAPGEFTMRSLANRKLDVSQAEAVRDLIDARSHAAITQSARQLSGELSARLEPLSRMLLDIIVPLESSLEFVEDDLPNVQVEITKQQLTRLASKLDCLAQTYNAGRLLKNGIKAVLLGRPNVGKSSVFNCLLAYERSIVTEVPGTTRDSLSEQVMVDNIPFLLVDTAGVRDSNDPVEQIGIERSKRAAADADLLLLIFDGTSDFTEEDAEVMAYATQGKSLIVVNKCDVPDQDIARTVADAVGGDYIPVSAMTGSGLDNLKTRIADLVSRDVTFDDGGFIIMNARHHDLLRSASGALRLSTLALEQRASEEIILVGLYNALKCLGDITGETTSEDVLGEIFSTFCIGK